MRSTNDGIYEVLLNGRQLAAVLAIVLLLVIGSFWVGQATAQPPPARITTTIHVPSPLASEAPPAAHTRQEATAAAAESERETPSAKPSPAGQPAVAEAKPQPAVPAASTAAEPEPTPARPAPVAKTDVPKGVYLQLAAGVRTQLEAMARTLPQSEFSVAVAPVEGKGELYRLLVGPYADAASIEHARQGLTKAGLQGTKAIARKF
jgi:cell division septation protein DedD